LKNADSVTETTHRIVFACSGRPENLAAIPWLAATFHAEVIALTLDVGQAEELAGIRQAAHAAGAVRAHVIDVREEFARQCIATSLDTDIISGYTAGRVVARRLVAAKLVEVARIEGARAVAHGGDATDHADIESTVHGLEPSMLVVAALAGSEVNHGIHASLWERAADERPRTPSRAEIDAPARLEIAFESGLPVAVNGVPMSLTEVIESVTTIAGNHGVGRVTDEASGTAVDAPAAVVFHAAHAALGAGKRVADATVCLELFKGQHRVLSAHLS
jgi:argininosuccinate synthase